MKGQRPASNDDGHPVTKGDLRDLKDDLRREITWKVGGVALLNVGGLVTTLWQRQAATAALHSIGRAVGIL